ncbi:high-affinity nicotinic acid transporter [Paraphoma chrysanthemicola]|uniref:High-affinity nicotinic acid transporter n=1 Tax=Paraphoma chrysanthemicola TaxID=798071 RepID=A0A8K0W1F8_9PLEO|nr:high-affinity nicotinic acid transporter [Paraphoma chrysanthemicola]
MSSSKEPEVVSALPGDISINTDVANEARQKASAKVSRADVVNLRDDPEAKAAFLSTFTAEEEQRIMRKVNKVFFLLTGIMYLIKQASTSQKMCNELMLTHAQVDQNNATNVRVLHVGKPSNIMKELKMSSNEYNWVGSIYGIAYIIFEAPSNLLLKSFAPHNWQARIFLTWGIITACHAAARKRDDLYAMRFLLGMFEAGMFPGLLAQFQAWYRPDEMGRVIAYFFCWSAVSGMVSALLAYAISYMDGIGGLSAWRWVYILEGLATILFSGAEFIETRLPESAPMTSDPNFSGKEIKSVLGEWLIWSFMLSQTLVNLGGYALTWYLPTIITNLGFVGLPRNQLLLLPPFGAAVLGLLFSAWFMERAWIVRPACIMFIMSGMVICFVLFFTISSRVGIYIACVLGNLFYQSYFSPFWAWRSATLIGSTGTAFTLGLQSGIAQLGGVVGPQLFQSKWAHNGYKTSFAIAAAFTIAGWVSNLWTWWLTRNTEYDVMRVRRLANQARKEGRTNTVDIKVFEERRFYVGRGLRRTKVSGSASTSASDV